jgi:hypothetical protein
METNIGYTLWSGPSRIDGSQVIVIATLHSDNTKTGDMVQTWILCRSLSPPDAVRWGYDTSICGDCPHRGTTCYVDTTKAPSQVYHSWLRGRYPFLPRDQYKAAFADRKIRIGAYGDPYAAPTWIWQTLAQSGTGHTGYTHQWQRADAAPLRSIVMASCDTLEEARSASSMGWRTFRIMPRLAITEREILCPASREAGERTVCERCTLCNGGSRAARHVAIVAHGSPVKLAMYRKRVSESVLV